MHFLGVYNLAAVLAVAGIVGVCTYSSHAAADGLPGFDDVDYSNYALPPAGAIINRPPTRVDNGYNPDFYWNRVADEDYADNDDDDDDSAGAAGYGSYGYQTSYPQQAYSDDSSSGDLGDGGYAGGADAGGYAYYGYAGDYGAYASRRVVVVRHEHRREAMNRVHHEAPGREVGRHDAYPAHVQPVEHRGYNGHDAHMFDADHRPAKPADAGYQVHGGNGQSRHDHRQ